MIRIDVMRSPDKSYMISDSDRINDMLPLLKYLYDNNRCYQFIS